MNFTPEQRQAITSDATRLCVDAGAGSGKTRVLIERIVHLVEHRQVPLEQIAAITFTDKAAAEMKARLRATFRTRAAGAEDHPQAFSRWRGLEQRVDTARISTIHAFCAGILREHALMIGIDPDFAVLGEAEGMLLLSDTVRSTVIGLLEADDPAAQALCAELGVSGLRTTLVALLRAQPAVRQVAETQPLQDPEALWVHWEGVLRRERERALSEVCQSPSIGAYIVRLDEFDGACSKESDGREVLRVEMLRHLRALQALGVTGEKQNAKTILGHLEGLQAKVGAARKANWRSDEVYEDLSKVQEMVKKFAAKACNWPELDPVLDREAAALSCALYAVYGAAATAWDAAKASRNVLDFDAMIQRARDVLRENAAVRARVAGSLRHVLMDEFQDTDAVQLEIALYLHAEPGGPDFFFVGDPKQSIYNFRGAEVEIFGEQRGRALEQVALQANFRTVPGVVGFVNAMFASTRMLQAVGAYAPMQVGRDVPLREAPHPHVEVLRMASRNDDGTKRSAEVGRRIEAQRIAARIAQLCAADGPAVVHDEASDTWRPARFGDIALLFRSTSSLYVYEEALREAGIDFVATAGSGFYRRQEVLDVVNALRVVVSPQDTAALAAFLRGPLGRMSDLGLSWLAESGGLTQAFASAGAPDARLGADDSEALAAARGLIATVRAHRHRLPHEVLAVLLAESGLESSVLDHHYGLQKASNLRKLQALALEFSTRAHASLERLVRYLADVGGQEALREGEALMQPFGGGAVTLMTVHKSKGLEFPVVFLCDMGQKLGGDKGQSPVFLHRSLGLVLRGANASGETWVPAVGEVIKLRAAAKGEAESARLLYVAMTRARDHLVLCGNDAPSPGSWFEALGRWAGILTAPNGAVVDRGAWRAQVLGETGLSVASTRARDARPDEAAVRAALARVAAPPTATPAPESISVSALLDRMGTLPDEDEPREELSNEQEAAANTAAHGDFARLRGSLVHRLIELWDFRGAPPVAAAMRGAPVSPDERAALHAALEAVGARFPAMPVFAALRGAARVQRELPFALRLDSVVVHGTIDALVDGALLVDYKTGRDTPEKRSRYALQLQLYAAALRALGAEVPRRGVVAFVDLGTELEVSLAADDLDAVTQTARRALGLAS